MRLQTKAKKIKKLANRMIDPNESPLPNYEKYDKQKINIPKNPQLQPKLGGDENNTKKADCNICQVF